MTDREAGFILNTLRACASPEMFQEDFDLLSLTLLSIAEKVGVSVHILEQTRHLRDR